MCIHSTQVTYTVEVWNHPENDELDIESDSIPGAIKRAKVVSNQSPVMVKRVACQLCGEERTA